MPEEVDEALRRSVLFRRLKPDDRQRLATVATVRAFEKSAMLLTCLGSSDQCLLENNVGRLG